MIRNCIVSLLSVAFVFLLLVSGAYGQAVAGSIGGTVRDVSGAIIRNARVTIVNQATGVQTNSTTNRDGQYRVPFLPVGIYRVRVEAPGFRTFERPDIDLQIADVLNIDASLAVGSEQAVVEVTTGVPLLQTETASTGNVIESDRIEDMPLNGRNFLQLTQLTADVNQGPKSGFTGDQFINPAQKGVSLSADGSRDTSTGYSIDGADVRGGFLGTITQVPALDTIQEFQVSTASFNAKDGRSPVDVSVVTKSGTNQIHGDLFWFVREEFLNAQNYFATASTKNLPWHQQNFGGTLGGPVVVPHFDGRNRTFFFFSYQGNRELYKSPKNLQAPPAAYRTGDFSALLPKTQLYYPATGAPIPGNIIPASMIQNYAQYITPNWGLPNIGATTWATANPYESNDNQFQFRIDHHISDHDQVFVRFGNTNPTWEQPVSGIGNPNFEGAYTQNGQNILAGETHIFNSQTVNEFRFSYNNSVEGTGPANGVTNYGPLFKWGGVTTTIGMPVISVSGYNALSDAPPGGYRQQTYQYSDTLSLHRGKHTISLGEDIFEFLTAPHNPGGFATPYPRASVSFNGMFSGNSFADFLLGYPASGSETINPAGYVSPPASYSYHDFNVYVQDDWKFSSHLAFNLGLRYEFVPPLRNPAMTTFLFDQGKYSQLGSDSALYKSPHDDFAPRFGFAWQPFANGNTVVRGGYGLYYDRVVTYGPGLLADNPPAVTSLSMSNSGLKGPQATTMATFLSNPSTTSSGGGWSVYPDFDPTPLTQIRSFDIQHQFPGKILLDVGYKGSLTTHEDGLVDENSPPPGPGAINPRRPYPNYGSLLTLRGAFSANYNAAIVRVEKRMGPDGLSLLASYAYGKCLDQEGTPISQSEEGNGMGIAEDRTDFNRDRGLCGADIRQRAVFSYMYQLPFGQGKRFLNRGGVLNEVVGGWSLSGITTFASGEPESVQDNFDISNTGEGLQRPDAYCNPNLPKSQRTLAAWFNPSCFGNLNLDPPYRYGTARRSMIITPGTNDWDVGALKEFPIHDAIHFEFRAEAFNAMNEVPLGEPNGTMGGSSLSSTGADLGTFPTISSAGNPRQIQLALKLLW